jgi:hypothetical protein
VEKEKSTRDWSGRSRNIFLEEAVDEAKEVVTFC